MSSSSSDRPLLNLSTKPGAAREQMNQCRRRCWRHVVFEAVQRPMKMLLTLGTHLYNDHELGVSKLLPNHRYKNIGSTFLQSDFRIRYDNIWTTPLNCHFGMMRVGGCVGGKPSVQVPKIGSFKTFVTDHHADSYSRLYLRLCLLIQWREIATNEPWHDALDWRTCWNLMGIMGLSRKFNLSPVSSLPLLWML
jgi:hypothetical protein